MTVSFSSTWKKTVFVDICTKMLRTKLEPVHFGSEVWTWGFFSGRKKDSHCANEKHSRICTCEIGVNMCICIYCIQLIGIG